MGDLKISVLGAGVVGLTTALELQKQFRNAQVTVIADKFNKETTSFVAAGLFRAGNSFHGPDDEVTRKWIHDSYTHWDDLRVTTEGSTAGLTEISGYIFSNISQDNVQNTYMEGLVPIYRKATEEELKLCPGDWKYGSFLSTLLIETSKYLPWAMQKFESRSGIIEQKSIQSFSDVDRSFDVIVNCTGLGSQRLCGDNKLVPIRGQVIKVKAPWIKTFFFGEYDTYIIPGFDTVTLGGCTQYGSHNLNFNKYDAMSIKEKCDKLVPSLKGAEILAHRVGLRPHRSPVRVDSEIFGTPGKKLKIVHNYGHGGYGVTYAPGTALHSVKLVEDLLKSHSKL